MAKSLFEYAAVYEWHVLAYAVILSTFFVKFLLSLFTFTPASIFYSLLLCLFFLINIVLAGYSIFVNSDKAKFFYAYSLLPQVILVVGMIVLISIFVVKPTIDPDRIDRIQPSLECCDSIPKDVSIILSTLANQMVAQPINTKAKTKKDVINSKSCCPKLDEDGDCTKELAWKESCDERYAEKVKRFKVRAIVLLIVTGFLQCLVFFSFYKRFLV